MNANNSAREETCLELTRYVVTNAIKSAVAGKEIDVLSSIGIEWHQNKGHIDCPYPDHGGKADWRWDNKKNRAFCTCCGNRGNKSSHSIFDVVTIKEGIDFEDAKIRVAEIIGRHDLIKTKGGISGNKYQKTDVLSLLNPPIVSLDNDLPAKYLGYRLRISQNDVFLPATKAVGWKTLSYYDPPSGPKGKPKEVGQFPCVVFETSDVDQKNHAMRIYVVHDGQGKAALGIGPNGRQRDTKKSAKVAQDDNTSGRSVIWGDPAEAPKAIVVEGIETGAAVALVFRAEIEAGEIAVFAAVTAGGMEAFKPWPKTKSVIVGADRDEGDKDGKAGSRRGERAARTFGLRNHEKVAVSIALPGKPGESVDWLDILHRNSDKLDGAEMVRAGILGAVPFHPTQAEIDGAAQEKASAEELSRINAEYPLPVLDRLALKYDRSKSGAIKIHVITAIVNDEPVWEPISTPCGVVSRLRYADHSDAYGLRISVMGMDGKPRFLDFDRGDLAIMAGSEIKQALLKAGLRVEDHGDQTLVGVLKAADPVNEIVVVSRTGWHRIGETQVFVGPGGDILGAPNGTTLELTNTAKLVVPAQAGTLDGWRKAVAAACSARDCPHWTLGTLAGFAGSILALTQLDTAGISLSGLSSAGKTLAQRLGVSVWTSPKLGSGLLQSMRTTENALESLAQSSHGTILALDELGHADGKSVGRMIYSIASGVGKSRATKDAKLKERYSWSTFAFFSGESSIEEKIKGDGGEFMAGMAVRIADIDVTGVNRDVKKVTLDEIYKINQNYGHAGPVFIQGLVDLGYRNDPEQLRNDVLDIAVKLAGEGADSARIRAATPFSLLYVAGILAKKFKLLPESIRVGDAIQWAWEKFGSSSDALALKPEEQAIRAIRQWILERWDVTIKHINASQDSGISGMRLNNREAVGWYDENTVYIPTSRIREASGKTVKEQQIGQILDQHNMLARRHDVKRASLRSVPKIGKIDCYALKRSEFGRTDHCQPDLDVINGGAL